MKPVRGSISESGCSAHRKLIPLAENEDNDDEYQSARFHHNIRDSPDHGEGYVSSKLDR